MIDIFVSINDIFNSKTLQISAFIKRDIYTWNVDIYIKWVKPQTGCHHWVLLIYCFFGFQRKSQSVQEFRKPPQQLSQCFDLSFVLFLPTYSCIYLYIVPVWSRGRMRIFSIGRGFQHLPRDLANVNALENHVRSLLLHKESLKTSATFRVISCTILFRLFTYISWTQIPRTMVLGPGSTHLVTAANLWPRYDHIESCVAVH